MTTSQDNFEILPSDIRDLDMIEAITVMDALKSRSMDATDEPESLPVTQVVEVPSVFQVRGGEVTESHIHALNEVLQRGQDLDPILVMRVGGSVVLVDGHHRLETYRRYEKKTKEPQRVRVIWHRGDVTNAMAEASQRNQKISLAMTKAQKLDNAWKMTVTKRFTIPQLGGRTRSVQNPALSSNGP